MVAVARRPHEEVHDRTAWPCRSPVLIRGVMETTSGACITSLQEGRVTAPRVRP